MKCDNIDNIQPVDDNIYLDDSYESDGRDKDQENFNYARVLLDFAMACKLQNSYMSSPSILNQLLSILCQ